MRRSPTPVGLRPTLDHLYEAFSEPESALDPVQVVRRYPRLDDREVVAFVASGLAFGRVASVMSSVEAVCGVMGRAPAAFIRDFEPAAHGSGLRRLGHRWASGDDLVALVWILKQLLVAHGSIEAAFGHGDDATNGDMAQAIERFSSLARAIDLRPAYGRRLSNPGAYYFFARPSTGSACKRLNLFLRWMVRRDGVDPGGWTTVPPDRLIVPLDTHTIRIGRCLRFTRRRSPGWKMAEEITEALRALDPTDPVRYDFALCHLSMMGACGLGTTRGSGQCPLRAFCRPGSG